MKKSLDPKEILKYGAEADKLQRKYEAMKTDID